jgi:hypothetical protein
VIYLGHHSFIHHINAAWPLLAAASILGAMYMAALLKGAHK